MEIIKQIKLILILMTIFYCNEVFACTIGVASGDITTNGRAMLWKTRDIGNYPENYLDWNEEGDYGFLYVRDLRDSLAWMGVNEKGLCMVNSYVERKKTDRPIFNNGSLIYHVLGHCATIEEMDTLLDTLNISEQVLSGNFGLIDSTGAGAIYEISWTEVQKYDVHETIEGYLIRTNFSLISGGDEGIERYTRSEEIIEELITEDELNAGRLFQDHFRDFSDDESEEIDVPFYDRWFFDRPWGYIKTNDSICRGIAASSVVFESVINDEPSQTTVMYALLGNPATSVYLPYFPIGMPPHQSTNLTGMQLTDLANQIKSEIFNFPLNSYYVDSFNLLEPDSIRIFDQIYPFETEMISETEEFLEEWRNGNVSDEEAEIHSEYWVNQGMMQLEDISIMISHDLEVEFTANIHSGASPLIVYFYDMTPHYPTELAWDFDNDGEFEVEGQETASWIYSIPGIYSVRLSVSNECSSDEVIYYDMIEVTEADIEEQEVGSVPIIRSISPNPFLINGNRSSLRIEYYLPASSKNVKLDIFNFRGQKVIHEVFEDTLKAGDHFWEWNGITSSGNKAANGVYLYRIKIPGYCNLSGKITIIK